MHIYIYRLNHLCVCVLDAYMYWLTSLFVHVYVLVYCSYGPDSHAFIFSVPNCIDAYTLAANNL